MDKVSNEIKYVSSRKNSRYNHNYYFGGLDPCEFLRNDIVDFCESAPDGSSQVATILRTVWELSEIPNAGRRRHWERKRVTSARNVK